MPKYKPMLIHFDEDGYNLAIKQSNERIHTYNQALEFASKHIEVDSPKTFGESFTAYFKEKFYESNRGKIGLEINVDKLLDLLDVDLTRLKRLEGNFLSNPAIIAYPDDNSAPLPNVDRNGYESYTTSSEQNEILRDARSLVEAIQRVGKHTTIYPYNIMQATSNLIGYDRRRNEYVINVQRRSS